MQDGGIRFESQITVTLSCDHRVIDGALGAELLSAFKMLMEQPVTMLV
jgi:pyruvate dehydrogenase E2 component (dihydrolipoamide acetyltransferase)